MALQTRWSESSLRLFLPSFLVGGLFVNSMALAAPDDIESGRQKIEALKTDLSLMMLEASHGLAQDDIPKQKALFEAKARELDLLRSRYQALVPVDFAPSEAPVISARDQISVTSDSPKTYEDVNRFLMMDTAHATVAMRDFIKVRNLDHENRWSKERVQIGTALTQALAVGISKGYLSTMTSLMSFLQFLGPHGSWFADLITGEPTRLLDSDKPVLIELAELSDQAVISWLKTKPAKQDVLDFFSAAHNRPLQWINGPFLGYQFFDEAQAFKTLLDTGWGENFSDTLHLLDLLNSHEKLEVQWIAKNVNAASSSREIKKLFESTNFEGKILTLESALRRQNLLSAADINLLLYELSSELRQLKRQSKLPKSTDPTYRTQLSWLRWLASSHLNQFVKLQPSEEQLKSYKEYGDLNLAYRFTKAVTSASRPKTLVPLQEAKGLQCRALY